MGKATEKLWHGVAVPPLFSSFSFEALMSAKRAAPHVPRGFLTKEIVGDDWARLAELEAVSVHTDHRTLTSESLERAKSKGLRVLLYTINDPEVARRWFDAGVDSIVTDNLAEFARRFPEALGA